MVKKLAKRCLICCGKSFPNKAGAQDGDVNCQQEGNDKGDTELQMVFLLRKILKIPEETCCKLRQRYGHESAWVKCCNSCFRLVEKCKDALEQAEMFQKQYKKIRSNIETKMLKSTKKASGAESKCEAIVRSHVITKAGKSNKSPRGSKSSPKTTEETEVVKNKCHVCLKFFKLPQDLKIHLRSHSSTCKTTAAKIKQNLKKRTAEKKHKCIICNKSFPWLYVLKTHMTVAHSGEKPFFCEFCDKAFPFADYLKKHSMRHSGEKPFKCRCGKAFIENSRLKNHQLMTHGKKKSFKCKACGKTFPSRAQRQNHQNQVKHSQDKPFKCDSCLKGFKTKEAVRQHRETHDEETS